MFFEKQRALTVTLALMILVIVAFFVVGCDVMRRNQDNATWSQITPAVKKIVEKGDRK